MPDDRFDTLAGGAQHGEELLANGKQRCGGTLMGGEQRGADLLAGGEQIGGDTLAGGEQRGHDLLTPIEPSHAGMHASGGNEADEDAADEEAAVARSAA